VLHAFNYTMAGLLILSILPGLWEQLGPYVAGANVK
jgi:hypothetical protein